MKRFQGKVAVITGSSDGIGFETARRLLSEGAYVVISSRKVAKIEKAVEQLKEEGFGDQISWIVCHVAKKDHRQQLLEHVKEKWGHLDCLVLNAGVSPMIPKILRTDSKAFDKIFEVNVKSNMLLVQEFKSIMRKGGSIVLVSSVGGYAPGYPHPAYGVSKTAVLGLSKALAAELAPKIRVNVVAPGMVKTAFSRPLWSNKQLEKAVTSQTLLRRLGEAGEVASTIAFLLSSDASYITGESIVVGGGNTMARL